MGKEEKMSNDFFRNNDTSLFMDLINKERKGRKERRNAKFDILIDIDKHISVQFEGSLN